LSLEHLLAKLINVEKFLQHKDTPLRGQRDERDLDYIKQSILSEVKKIDMQRLRSTRYSSKAQNDEEENFSLTIAQFMYKIENLEQKFEKSISNVEKSLVDFSPDFNRVTDSKPLDAGMRQLIDENKSLNEKIASIENRSMYRDRASPTNSFSQDTRSLEKQIMNLKEIHSAEIKHIQTTHDKLMFQTKDMNRQKELRMQERIDLLSKTAGDRDLNIVRDLQFSLDKIRSITKPIYSQHIRDYPDFQPLQNERLEVTYSDFAVFLAKQATSYMHKLENFEQENQPFVQEEPLTYRSRDRSASRSPSRSHSRNRSPTSQLDKNTHYPSVTNLLSHQNEKNHFKNSFSKKEDSEYKRPKGGDISISDIDLQKALKIQQEFERQHNALVNELAPGIMHKPENKENHKINMRTVSVPNFVPYNLSHRDMSRKSLQTDIKETIHSERNRTFKDKGQYVTLSQDNSMERLAEQQSPYNASQNIRSVQMSSKMSPRSASNIKTKFGHLLHRKKA